MDKTAAGVVGAALALGVFGAFGLDRMPQHAKHDLRSAYAHVNPDSAGPQGTPEGRDLEVSSADSSAVSGQISAGTRHRPTA